jgi:hypothetical protein
MMLNNSSGFLEKYLSGIFSGITGLALILAILIVVLPGNVFLALSNYLQIITAFAGAAVLTYLWTQSRNRTYFLSAGAGFFLWGLSNTGWYVNALMGLRSQSFPGIFDLGMILAIVIMALALWKGLPGKKIPASTLALLLVICLVVPAGVILTTGISMPALATLAFFLSCGLLIAGGLDLSFGERPLLMLGTILFALAFMVYPLREIYGVENPLLSVIGPVVCAGFALIVLGLLSVATGQTTQA